MQRVRLACFVGGAVQFSRGVPEGSVAGRFRGRAWVRTYGQITGLTDLPCCGDNIGMATELRIRLTPEEREKLDQAARQSHLKVSTWARAILLHEANGRKGRKVKGKLLAALLGVFLFLPGQSYAQVPQ